MSKKLKQMKTGKVVTMGECSKSAVVRVIRRVRHKLYKKIVIKSTKFQVHVEGLELKVGDTVNIVPCKPVSKNKAWKVVEVVEQQAS